MGAMKVLGLAAILAAAALSACRPWEPDYRNYGARPHEWELAGPDYRTEVFGPIPSEEAKDWRTCSPTGARGS